MNQWKTCNCAELKLYCEVGKLNVNMYANLGEWREHFMNNKSDIDGGGCKGLWKASPSRQKKREKRSAERAVVKAAAEKAAAAQNVAAVEIAAADNSMW